MQEKESCLSRMEGNEVVGFHDWNGISITNYMLGDSPKIVFDEVLLSLLPKNLLDEIFPLLEEVAKNLLIAPPAKRSHSADARQLRQLRGSWRNT